MFSFPYLTEWKWKRYSNFCFDSAEYGLSSESHCLCSILKHFVIQIMMNW